MGHSARMTKVSSVPVPEMTASLVVVVAGDVFMAGCVGGFHPLLLANSPRPKRARLCWPGSVVGMERFNDCISVFCYFRSVFFSGADNIYMMR